MDNNVSENECGKQMMSKITSGIWWSVPRSAAAQMTKWISSQDFDQDHLESLTVSKECEQCVKQNTCSLHRKTDSVLCVLGMYLDAYTGLYLGPGARVLGNMNRATSVWLSLATQLPGRTECMSICIAVRTDFKRLQSIIDKNHN